MTVRTRLILRLQGDSRGLRGERPGLGQRAVAPLDANGLVRPLVCELPDRAPVRGRDRVALGHWRRGLGAQGREEHLARRRGVPAADQQRSAAGRDRGVGDGLSQRWLRLDVPGGRVDLARPRERRIGCVAAADDVDPPAEGERGRVRDGGREMRRAQGLRPSRDGFPKKRPNSLSFCQKQADFQGIFN